MISRVRTFLARVDAETKGHAVVGVGYLGTLFTGGHNSALTASAYGVATLLGVHVTRKGKRKSTVRTAHLHTIHVHTRTAREARSRVSA